MPGMDFSAALHAIKAGIPVERIGWNARGQYIRIARPTSPPDTPATMTLPYLYIRTVQGELVPWVPSQTDLLATDWREFQP